MPITLQISHPDRMAAGLTAEELATFRTRLHEAPPTLERGPIALVADRETGPLSELFARPVRVFRSIHAAREWLQANTEYP